MSLELGQGKYKISLESWETRRKCEKVLKKEWALLKEHRGQSEELSVATAVTI